MLWGRASIVIDVHATVDEILALPVVVEAVNRGFVSQKNGRVTYFLSQTRTYNWADREEWIRCFVISFLVINKSYPACRMRTEVSVPRRVPDDHADIVVYRDDACKDPYLIVECKAAGQAAGARSQGIEQAFGNANSLRAPFTLYDEGSE